MPRLRFHRTLHCILCAALMLSACPAIVRAQGGAGDSIVVRVQRMAGDGNVTGARAVVDSALGATKEGSPEYVDALFARASIAASADAARQDYLRIAVDFSNSPRAEDSLLRLAQMELARSDRAAAKQYLDRLALEHPGGASRAQGAYWLGRVLIDDGALPAACASLAEAKARVAPTDIELANQIIYYSRPCAALQRAADSARADSIDKVMKAAHADSVARADSIAKAEAAAKKKAKQAPKKEAEKNATLGKEPAKAATSATKGPVWSAQVAAYSTPEDAQRLAKKLGDRGYDARVTGEKPYRVRIGRYARRADATDMVAKLKDAKMAAIVVEAEKP
jgi:cell division septation protein DedD